MDKKVLHLNYFFTNFPLKHIITDFILVINNLQFGKHDDQRACSGPR